MNCTNCGTSNLDNATICVNCSRPLTASYTPPPPPPPPPHQPSYIPPTGAGGASAPGAAGPQIPNYLLQAILTTLCCCLPLGIVAIIFSVQVNSKLQAGDVGGATEASRQAKKWCWIAFGVGLLVWIIWMGLSGAAFVQTIRESVNT